MSSWRGSGVLSWLARPPDLEPSHCPHVWPSEQRQPGTQESQRREGVSVGMGGATLLSTQIRVPTPLTGTRSLGWCPPHSVGSASCLTSLGFLKD